MDEAKISKTFAQLFTHKKRLSEAHMRDMFAQDESRFSSFSAFCGDLLLDYSKNCLDEPAMADLFSLARIAGVEKYRDDMWAAKPINFTEDRSVLHMALRYQGKSAVLVDGEDVMPAVKQVLNNIREFSQKIRSGGIIGSTGKKFTDIVSIGIGGSDLGPAMVTAALAPYANDHWPNENLRVHYVSNVDGADLGDTLKALNPANTMFIVASKTFTTDETMTNAASARDWLISSLGKEAIAAHFTAISTNIAACRAFGIKEARIFGFWDWVGGRYSVWSAIGLPVALAIGFESFEKFLMGAAEMDSHFLQTPIEKNLPVILALIGIWHRNICDFSTLAILPYDQRMSRFPAYLQQLDMESNGKRTTLRGKTTSYATGPIVWGEPGTNGQHAFYQLLHQGTDIVPCDFLIAANPDEHMGNHHAKLVANCFAQSKALMTGKDIDQVMAELKGQGMDAQKAKKIAPHKVFPGNRPSNTIVYKQLDPETLGALIALYEHKIFVQGVIWGINSFDQWGVELGKQLAKDLLPLVLDSSKKSGEAENDSSTNGLLDYFHKLKT
ncbi:MAG: glucose-6-phosphate isomerase [Devosiaceae bacterium]|nr:glucose-6-phosphate isomerase [Devosiaceae bacterium]